MSNLSYSTPQSVLIVGLRHLLRGLNGMEFGKARKELSYLVSESGIGIHPSLSVRIALSQCVTTAFRLFAPSIPLHTKFDVGNFFLLIGSICRGDKKDGIDEVFEGLLKTDAFYLASPLPNADLLIENLLNSPHHLAHEFAVRCLNRLKTIPLGLLECTASSLKNWEEVFALLRLEHQVQIVELLPALIKVEEMPEIFAGISHVLSIPFDVIFWTLRDHLFSDDRNKRIIAAEVLVKMAPITPEDNECLKVLLTRHIDKEERVRRSIVGLCFKILETTHNEDARLVIGERLADPDCNIRAFCLQGLEDRPELIGIVPLDEIKKRMNDKVLMLRLKAIRLLAKSCPFKCLNDLIACPFRESSIGFDIIHQKHSVCEVALHFSDCQMYLDFLAHLNTTRQMLLNNSFEFHSQLPSDPQRLLRRETREEALKEMKGVDEDVKEMLKGMLHPADLNVEELLAFEDEDLVRGLTRIFKPEFNVIGDLKWQHLAMLSVMDARIVEEHRDLIETSLKDNELIRYAVMVLANNELLLEQMGSLVDWGNLDAYTKLKFMSGLGKEKQEAFAWILRTLNELEGNELKYLERIELKGEVVRLGVFNFQKCPKMAMKALLKNIKEWSPMDFVEIGERITALSSRERWDVYEEIDRALDDPRTPTILLAFLVLSVFDIDEEIELKGRQKAEVQIEYRRRALKKGNKGLVGIYPEHAIAPFLGICARLGVGTKQFQNGVELFESLFMGSLLEKIACSINQTTKSAMHAKGLCKSVSGCARTRGSIPKGFIVPDGFINEIYTF